MRPVSHGTQDEQAPGKVGIAARRRPEQASSLPLGVALQTDQESCLSCLKRNAEDLNDFLEQALDQGMTAESATGTLALAESANGMVFLLITVLGLLMAIVYVPIRLFLTITARSRRLKLLQKIRRLRDEIGDSLKQD